MKLTVLGANATYPTETGPASGFLVQNDGRSVVVDAGPGTVVKLLPLIDINSLEGVVISHAHADHCADVAALYFRLRYGPEVDRRIPLFAPAGVFEHLERFLTYSPNGSGFRQTFDERTVGDGDRVRLIGMRWSFRRTDHPVPCVATRVDNGDKSITYTSDTGPNIDLRPLTTGTDILMAEATFQGESNEGTQHLTAAWAGRLAADSQAGRLVLTHIRPDLDAAVSIKQAQEHFSGPVDAASSGMVLEP
jgi:ribonuclease BN (tRNA processing enzyme)